MRLRLVVVLAAASLVGCGHASSSATGPGGTGGNGATGDGSGGSGDGSGGTGTGGNGGLPGPVPATCSGKSAPASADDTWTLMVGGLARTAHVHLPPSYDPGKAMPLVLNFHGYTSNAMQEDLLSGMNAKADAAGFIAIEPEGTGATAQSWNAGACCGDAVANNVDDVAFVNAILDTAEDQLCVDTHRIFSTGMSNGGFLSHRLGCELADRIAAIAPVAGVLGIPTCTPSRPMPVIHFHGTADPLVPYDGNASMNFPSVPDTFAGWAMRDHCNGMPVETFRMADAHCSSYLDCAGGAQVTLCTVDNGGHTWPGGLPVPSLGYTTPNLSATDAMWSFFQSHPLP